MCVNFVNNKKMPYRGIPVYRLGIVDTVQLSGCTFLVTLFLSCYINPEEILMETSIDTFAVHMMHIKSS